MSSMTQQSFREDTDASQGRWAVVRNAQNAKVLAAYLPDNYTIAAERSGDFLIVGYDWRGWTMNDYVIPRLASGLIWAEEVRSLIAVIDFLREES